MYAIRHPFPDSVKQEVSSNSLDENNLDSLVPNDAVLSTSIVLAQENCNITCSLNKASVDLVDESSSQPDFSQSAQVDNVNPNHNTLPFYGVKLDFKQDISCTPSERVKLVQDASENTQNSFANNFGYEVKFSADQTKEDASGSDWENLISDNTDDLFIFEPATGSEPRNYAEKDKKISLNSKPNASCLQNDPQGSVMDDDGETRQQHGVSHMLKLFSTTCHEPENIDDLNQKTEAELNDDLT